MLDSRPIPLTLIDWVTPILPRESPLCVGKHEAEYRPFVLLGSKEEDRFFLEDLFIALPRLKDLT